MLVVCAVLPVAALSQEAPPPRLTVTGAPTDLGKVTLSLEDQTVAQALALIADKAKLNLVVVDPDELDGRITLKLRDVPTTDALEAILGAAGVVAELDGRTLEVTSRGRSLRMRAGVDGSGVRVEADVDDLDDDDHEDRVVTGGDITVAANEVISGDAVAVGGDITVLGRVEGNAVAVGGDVILEPSAHVAGDAVAVGGTTEVAPGAFLGGDRVGLGGSIGKAISSLVGAPSWAAPLFGIAGTLLRAMTLFVVALLCLSFAPRRIERVATFWVEHPGRSVLGGLLLLVGTGPLCVALAITVIGLPLVPLVVGALVALVAFGLTAVMTAIGARVLRFFDRGSPLAAMLVGLLVLTLVDFIPLVGTPVLVLVGFVAGGAALLSRLGQETTTLEGGSGGPGLIPSAVK